MDGALLVLYRDAKMTQSWCLYHGGTAEADNEFKILTKNKSGLREHGRIWVVQEEIYVAIKPIYELEIDEKEKK